MSNFVKVILLILLVGYVISPVDVVPGPIDDAILAFCMLGGGMLTLGKKD